MARLLSRAPALLTSTKGRRCFAGARTGGESQGWFARSLRETDRALESPEGDLGGSCVPRAHRIRPARPQGRIPGTPERICNFFTLHQGFSPESQTVRGGVLAHKVPEPPPAGGGMSRLLKRVLGAQPDPRTGFRGRMRAISARQNVEGRRNRGAVLRSGLRDCARFSRPARSRSETIVGGRARRKLGFSRGV